MSTEQFNSGQDFMLMDFSESSQSTIPILDASQIECDDQPVIEESSQELSQVNRLNRKRHSYTIGQKLEAIRMYEITGNKKVVCDRLQIPRKNLYRWIEQKDILVDVKDKAGRIKARRRIREAKGKWPTLEAILKTWFSEQREKGIQINRSHIHSEGKRLAQSLGIGSVCSNGWITRFLKRNGLSLRVSTSVGQKVPVNAKELALNFLTYLGDLRKKYGKCDTLIYANMDEVPVWFDSPSNRTYDFSGNKTVFVRTTNHEKTRFTVVLTSLSTGEKCQPMIIYKASNRRLQKETVSGVCITGSPNGSMNTEIMEKWRSEIWAKRPNHIQSNISHRFSNIRTILIMDSFNVHKDEEILGKLDRLNNTEVAIIPGGMTKFLQPADVVYNRSFKNLIRSKWQQWIANGPFEYTKTGNRRHASFKIVAQWVKESWDEVETGMIKRSFDKCGILDEDNSEYFHSQLINILTGAELESSLDERTESSEEEN